MPTLCAICDDPIPGGECVEIEEDDDPYDSFDDGDVAHDKCLRRHRAAVEQAKRMFETYGGEKDYEKHTEIEDPVTDIDEDEIDAKIEELEAELEEELREE